MPLEARAAAATALGAVLAGQSLNQVLPPLLSRVGERDRGLVQQLCYGTLRHAPRLQALLQQLLSKPLRDKDRDIQGLLLCGLYQLDDMRIPDHAAVAATVGATRSLRKNWAKGLTNAVLRRYLRERKELLAGLDEAALASHPEWLLQLLRLLPCLISYNPLNWVLVSGLILRYRKQFLFRPEPQAFYFYILQVSTPVRRKLEDQDFPC